MFEQDLSELKNANRRTQYELKNVNEALMSHMVVQNGVYLTPTEEVIHRFFVRLNDLETNSGEGDLEYQIKI